MHNKNVFLDVGLEFFIENMFIPISSLSNWDPVCPL